MRKSHAGRAKEKAAQANKAVQPRKTRTKAKSPGGLFEGLVKERDEIDAVIRFLQRRGL